MAAIEDLLHELPALKPLAPEHRGELASCSRTCVFHADEWIMREGEDAGAFYVIRQGAVALETAVPASFVAGDSLSPSVERAVAALADELSAARRSARR